MSPATSVVHDPAPTGELLRTLAGYLAADAPAVAMPPQVFSSPELYELERRQIFARSWIAIGRSDQLATGGAPVSVTIAGEPVVVARAGDGSLQALFAGAVDEWQGFVFVNLDPTAPPLSAWVAGLEPALPPEGIADAVTVGTTDEVWNANWKLVLENGSETYHHMGVHPQTVDPISPSSAKTYVRSQSPSWVELRNEVKARPGDDAVPESSTITVFPNMQVLPASPLTLWGTFLPLGPDRTRILGGFLLSAETAAEADLDEVRAYMGSWGEAVVAEDRAVGESIQRVVGSRFAHRGPLSFKEPGLPVFYRYLARSLCLG